MKNMTGHLSWWATGSSDPDEQSDVCIEVTNVLNDGTVEITYPEGKGDTYLRFSLRDLMEQVCRQAGAEE